MKLTTNYNLRSFNSMLDDPTLDEGQQLTNELLDDPETVRELSRVIYELYANRKAEGRDEGLRKVALIKRYLRDINQQGPL